MRKYFCGIFISLLLLGIFVTPVLAGGLIMYELGTPDVGLASAGYAARAQDAGTIATNPAGMTRIQGSEFLLGTQALYGDVAFSKDANTTTNGGNGGNMVGWVPGASAFYVNEINPDLKIGMGVFGNFGLAYEYRDSWAGRYFTTEGVLMGLSLMPSVAYRVNEQISVGLALNIMYGIFETEAAVNTILPGDGKLEYEDNAWGIGANLGVLYEVNKATRFGLTYCSEVSLEFKDTLDISGAVITISPKLELEFDKPQTVMASFFHELDEQWAVLGNAGWEDWSQFGKVGVQINSATSITADRNYKDTWHGAIGAQYRYSDPWLLSFGIAYDSGMMDDKYRTPDLPMGDTWRFGFGAQYEWDKDLLIGIGYTLVWIGDLDMDQQKGTILGGTDTLSGEYKDTSMHFFSVNFRWM